MARYEQTPSAPDAAIPYPALRQGRAWPTSAPKNSTFACRPPIRNSEEPSNFYERCSVLRPQDPFPETVMIETGRVNFDDIHHSDIVVANIQQIAGEEN